MHFNACWYRDGIHSYDNIHIATTTNQPDAFDARVERAWAYMKGAFFAVEEHERLRMVLARLITADTL